MGFKIQMHLKTFIFLVSIFIDRIYSQVDLKLKIEPYVCENTDKQIDVHNSCLDMTDAFDRQGCSELVNEIQHYLHEEYEGYKILTSFKGKNGDLFYFYCSNASL